MGHPYWPLFDLRIRTPRLELRVPTEDDFPGLLDAIDAGIHDPDDMPFLHPWTDADPPERRRNAVQFWWRCRAEWKPESWALTLGVFVDGRPIGFQDLRAERFTVLREVETGSWLTRSMQGRGIGKEMRTGALQLAFDELGAEVARSEAFVGNERSLAVSRALGYRDNGRGRAAPRGEVREVIELMLTREDWQRAPRPFRAAITGLEGSLELFGSSPRDRRRAPSDH